MRAWWERREETYLQVNLGGCRWWGQWGRGETGTDGLKTRSRETTPNAPRGLLPGSWGLSFRISVTGPVTSELLWGWGGVDT